MKKLCILLSAIILLLSPIQGIASSKSNGADFDKEKVAELKKVFNITNEYKQFDFSTRKERKSTIYSYHWYGGNKGVDISTNEKGTILSFSQFSYDDSIPKKIILKDKKEMEKIATEFLNKLDSNLVKEYKLIDSNVDIRGKNATFSYVKYVNDIMVLSDYLEIVIDLGDKNITRFHRSNVVKSFSNADFPDASKAISIEKAKEVLTSDNPYKLAYKITGDYSSKPSERTVIPVYTTLNKNLHVDAISGELFKGDVDEVYYFPETYRQSSDFSYYERAMAPIEELENPEKNGLSTIEAAKKEAASKLDLTDYKFQNANFSTYGSETSYHLSYRKENDRVNITLNAKTLEIESLHFGNFYDYESETAELEKEEALAISKPFLKKLNKNLEKYDLENPEIFSYIPGYTSLSFYRKEQSYPVLGDSISLEIDSEKKQISSYNASFSKITFPQMEEGIGSKKALDIALNKSELIKYYVYTDAGVKLIYAPKNNETPLIRSKDGVILDWNGEPKEETSYAYKDIDSSKYKDEIKYLLASNIGIPKIENLKEKIKVKDYIYLLNSVSDNNFYFNSNPETIAEKYEQLDPNDLNKNITTRQAVRWGLNAKNYYDLNNAKEVFKKDTFTDIQDVPKEDHAYYFLSYALGYYNDNKALPNEELTHEEALHLIYNLLN